MKVADAHTWSKKTYNNSISAVRRAFEFGFRDHPDRYNPARALKSARIGRKDRPRIDPFTTADRRASDRVPPSRLGRSAG